MVLFLLGTQAPSDSPVLSENLTLDLATHFVALQDEGLGTQVSGSHTTEADSEALSSLVL